MFHIENSVFPVIRHIQLAIRLFFIKVGWLIGWLYWCFAGIGHILGNFGRGQLT